MFWILRRTGAANFFNSLNNNCGTSKGHGSNTQTTQVVCLVVSGICGVAIIKVDIPIVAIYLYVILLLCGLVINVLSAATVDIYPTHLRAMAVCISLMMGRFGSVIGASIVGALITSHCESVFLSSGISIIFAGLLGFLIVQNSKFDISSRSTSLVSMTGN